MKLTIELDREVDGRWIAEVPELNVLLYGDSKRDEKGTSMILSGRRPDGAMIESPYPRCVSGPRRAPTAGRPTRQAPARTSETLQGSLIPGSRPISMRRGPGIQPLPTIPLRLSFRAGFSRGYHRLRNTGFTRSTRSEITRRTEKEQAFIRSMTA